MLHDSEIIDDIFIKSIKRNRVTNSSKYKKKHVQLFNQQLVITPVTILLFLSSILVFNCETNSDFIENKSLEEIENSISSTLTLKEMSKDQLIGQGEIIYPKDGKKLLLPLIQTDVKAKISDYLARVIVNQTFVNVTDSTIEALYTFPLPENSAVDSMIMTIGNKRIKAIIKERGEARAIYEQARRDGKTASLLEQQRPNIFRQAISNILKDDTINITISYVQEIEYSNGEFLFNFPMVVGPRYIPGADTKPSNNGTVNPTDQVPDADMITPPIVPENYRSGHNITLSVDIEGGIKISEIKCESHKINISNISSTNYNIKITPNDNIPNKDFILKYQLGGKEIRNSLLTTNIKNNGFFQLTILPQIDIKDKDIIPRELIFIIDNSGSMRGFPLNKCKELMIKSLKSMRPNDKFNILKFAGHTELMSQMSLSNNEQNRNKGIHFINNMSGGGGTEMMSAINKLFTMKHTPGRKRLVLFLTDGFIGNDVNLITTIRDHLKSSRVFTLGVGSSVNHYLLKSMAHVGGGQYRYIRQDGEADKAVKEFYRLIDAPLLTNIKAKISGINVTNILPEVIPDLYSGAPLSLTGKYKNSGTATITVTGDLPAGKTFKRVLKANFPSNEMKNNSIKTLWGRRKIGQLELYGTHLFNGNSYTPDKIKDEITKLGLEFKIMSKYTSFVAVDDAIRNKSGKWISLEQAVKMPEGVSYKGIPKQQIAKIKAKKNKSTGGEFPRAKVQKKGVLGILSEAQSTNSINVQGDMSGFSQGINAVLSGAGGLKSGSGASSARKSSAGIGFGAGVGSGFGGGSNNSDELISSLMGSQSLSLKKRGTPKFTKGGAMTGGRSRANIMRTIRQNLASLKYAYNKRLRLKPQLKGKVTVKFAINEFGKVIFVKIINSTLNDPELEKVIESKIKRWVFDEIDKPGDVTEVVYPFVFSK